MQKDELEVVWRGGELLPSRNERENPFWQEFKKARGERKVNKGLYKMTNRDRMILRGELE